MTYNAGKCVVERVSEREADLEPLEVRQVTRHAPEERGRRAQPGEIERAHGQAPLRHPRELRLRRQLAPHEAEHLHGPPGEEGRGGGGVSAEGAQTGHVRGREA